MIPRRAFLASSALAASSHALSYVQIRGHGRVFYFRPGHETYPVYLQSEPLRVLVNAVLWLVTSE